MTKNDVDRLAELMNKGMDQEERQRAEIIADLMMKEQGII